MFGKHRLMTVLVLLISLLAFNLHSSTLAASLLSRKVTTGSSTAGATTFHNYDFTLASAGSLGSIVFEYCSNTPFFSDSCLPPAGLDLSGANLSSQSGEENFSIHNSSTTNKLVIGRTVDVSLALQAVSYRFDNVVNNTDEGQPVFVRISTYQSDNGAGARVDEGAVVFTTARNVRVEGYVPPYLTFCTGIEVAVDCASSRGNFIDLGELDFDKAKTGSSQYAGATNDPGGYSTTLLGTTMASGTNTIPALSQPDASKAGVSQFGINLRANTSPAVGANRSGSGSAQIVNGYGTPNRFKFANQVISRSAESTEFNRFTVTYLVNVSRSQSPGIYASTFTYLAVAAF